MMFIETLKRSSLYSVYTDLRKSWNKIKERKWKHHIEFIPSYRCNFKCPYCNLWRLYNKFPERNYLEWLNFFNELPKSIIDLTGGEPFFYSGFRFLVLNLSHRHKISVTTNLSYDPYFFKKLWKLFNSITISYHPHSMGIESFIENCLRLKEYREKNIVCNIVGFPDQLDKIHEYIEKIQGLNIPCHIDPYINSIFEYSEEEKIKLEELRDGLERKPLRKMGFDFGDSEIVKLCNAGMKHFILLPDGSTQTCMSGFLQNYDDHYMGNVFSKNWKPRKKIIKCNSSCSFGCDLDWIKSVTIRESEYHLSLKYGFQLRI